MKISSIIDLQKITSSINKILLPGDVIFLYGQIGVGKTTFVRLLINNYENEKKLKTIMIDIQKYVLFFIEFFYNNLMEFKLLENCSSKNFNLVTLIT